MSLSRKIARLKEASEAERVPPTEPPPRRRSRLWRTLVWLVRLGVGGVVLGTALLAGVFWYFSHDLPTFESLEDYHPPQSTRLVSTDGVVVGELFEQRRTVVPFADIPPVLIQAVVAAEDRDFYEHTGLDYVGIVRAALKNLKAGRVKEGASTITQQVVKTFLLTPERKFRRKIREMILARQLENNLLKDEILYLYLNQIYFGHGRYGVEEASRFYFGKPVRDLDLGEAALIAGLPKAPAYYSPRRYPKKAKKRQAYVLGQMVLAGFITQAEADTAKSRPLRLPPRPAPPPGPWYVEEVRRRLESRLGTRRLLEDGLTVMVAMDSRLQAAAERAFKENLRAVDKRQGWRGAQAHFRPAEVKSIRERYQEVIDTREERLGKEEPLVWDLDEMTRWDFSQEGDLPVRAVKARAAMLVTGLVTESNIATDTARVDLGDPYVTITLKSVRWARRFDTDAATDPPVSITDVLNVGDVVWIRLGSSVEGKPVQPGTEKSRKVAGTLEQLPKVQGAFVAIEPGTHRVLAMVGGYDIERSSFNRVTQARRQPGSSFKPFVYGTAIDSGEFTVASRMLDAPQVFHDPWTGKVWKPQNSGHRFDGEMSLRTALARSKNIVSVRIAVQVGVDTIIDFARRAGIESRLPRVLPLALGAGEVTPMELTNAYATIAGLGVYQKPVLVLEVLDHDGRSIERHTPAPEQRIRQSTSYVLADLLTTVMKEGTGRRMNKLGRPVAGKTGTTNDQRDAWFVGFTPDIVAGSWVGFDEPRQLGPREYGAKAAGPAWLEFMKVAVEGTPARWFDPPEGVIFARIEEKSGLLARPGQPGVFEPFIAGTEPLDDAPPSDVVDPSEFLLEDRGLTP